MGKINWNEILPLIGHGIENDQLIFFMFETLKLDESLKDQDPIDDWDHFLESESGIIIDFDYSSLYEEMYFLKPKSDGDLILTGITMHHLSESYKDYVGELPYKLNFSMSDREVQEHLKEMFIDVYCEDGKVLSSIFYDSKNKVMMTIGYEYSDNIQKIGMVYIYAPDNESVEEYGIGSRIIE